MATRDEVQAEIIDRMTALWTQPKTSAADPTTTAKVLGEYVDALVRFDVETLRKSFVAVRDSWRGASWPHISAFVTACQELRTTPPDRSVFPGPFPQKADQVMRGPLGQQAIREKWPWQLWLHVYEKGETPSGQDQREYREAVRDMSRALTRLAEHPEEHPPGVAKALQSMGEKMMAKNLDMAAKYSA